ncbi:MAG TPA: hypothetical protein VMD97_01470 [Candidatus Aquilonibacter sp.]|nr:hypothetical protein [Candidatus Aquilonibacter sp.]
MSLKLGSRERSAQDAAFYVAKRRLHSERGNAHLVYTDIECVRLVERLRAIRDVYREHLERLGCRPIGQMYWVIFRFGVMAWALRLLRSSVQTYLTLAAVPRKQWEELFGPLVSTPLGEPPASVSERELLTDGPQLQASIAMRLPVGVFDHILDGGPFGLDAQVYIAHETFGLAALEGKTLPESIEYRENFWRECSRWVEPLSRLFDAVQEELIFQANALSEDGRRSEALFHHLPLLQQIAYKYLVALRTEDEGRIELGEEGWLALMYELDDNNVELGHELPKRAREVLTSLRRSGARITTWREAYSSRRRVSLEDAKTYTLRREAMMALHNAAKLARRALQGSAEI